MLLQPSLKQRELERECQALARATKSIKRSAPIEKRQADVESLLMRASDLLYQVLILKRVA